MRISPAVTQTTPTRTSMRLRSAIKEVPMEVDNSNQVIAEEAIKDEETTQDTIPGELCTISNVCIHEQ